MSFFAHSADKIDEAVKDGQDQANTALKAVEDAIAKLSGNVTAICTFRDELTARLPKILSKAIKEEYPIYDMRSQMDKDSVFRS